jgi:hypothetical protein
VVSRRHPGPAFVEEPVDLRISIVPGGPLQIDCERFVGEDSGQPELELAPDRNGELQWHSVHLYFS